MPKTSSKSVKPNLLDSLLILLVASALVLFILWVVFQMSNLGERFGTLPAWVETVVGKTWAWLTASGSSILVYWLRKRTNAPTPDYLRWILGVSGGLLATVMLMAAAIARIVPPASPSDAVPDRVDLDFSFRMTDTSPALAADQLVMKPMHPTLSVPRYIVRQQNGRFVEPIIEVPKPKKIYSALLRRKAIESSKQAGSAAVELCFERAAAEPILQASVRFDCEEGRTSCAVVKENLFWVVPSLKSLKENGRMSGTGYTKFVVRSVNLPSIEASAIRYQISVNGTIVRIDGFSPAELAGPFDPKKGVEIDFGLQNLDFKGADEGHDTVGLKIDLLKGSEPVRQFDLKLCYVALRSAPSQTVQVADGAFEWKADYVHAKNEREYEVFVHSTKDPKNAETRRSQLSKLAWTYTDGSRIHGVTRPSLSDNPNYGVAVGLEQPSGQIRFTYEQAAARELLQWLKSKRTDAVAREVVSQDSYIYRVGSREQVQSPCKVRS
jgi:hypothetical protein